ncbi:hypothetical protein D3C75_950000 [compost metagenome]
MIERTHEQHEVGALIRPKQLTGIRHLDAVEWEGILLLLQISGIFYSSGRQLQQMDLMTQLCQPPGVDTGAASDIIDDLFVPAQVSGDDDFAAFPFDDTYPPCEAVLFASGIVIFEDLLEILFRTPVS